MKVLTAIAEGNPDALATALSEGEDPHTVDTEGVPAVLHAADTGRVDLVKPLLDAGAVLTATDNLGWTPLMAAVAAKSSELVGVLLTHGANPNHVAREDTPLTIAASESELGIVTLLLNQGADPDLRRPDGWTPLMLAAFRGDAARVRLLLEHGADPTVTMGSRLVDAATVAAAHGHVEVRDQLLAAAREAAPSIDDLWGGVQKWCETRAPDLAAKFVTRTPDADAPDLPEDWADLPDDARRQLTNWASGLPFYDYEGLDLEDAVAVWTRLDEQVASGEMVGRSASALGPDEPIARRYWHSDWVPVARDGDGNLLIVDLAPEDTGIPGQLVSWSVEQGPLSVLASGLTPYLRLLAARLRGGRLKVDKRSGGLIPV